MCVASLSSLLSARPPPHRHQDPRKQQTASLFFHRIQEAYRILSDPRKRAIYDRSGKKGVESDMALIERTTLPKELLEEYEKLKALWEERTYIQEANPQGRFQVKVDASPLLDGSVSPHQPLFSLRKITVTQAVDAQITRSASANIGASVVGTPRYLVGGLQFSLRYILSHQSWVKLTTLIGTLPALGLETYHSISDAMYVTTASHCTFTPYGVAPSLNATATRRLTDTTSASLSVKDSGSAVSTQVVCRVSNTVSVVGEMEVGFNDSSIEGKMQYNPENKYFFHGGVRLSGKGLTVSYGAEHEVAKLTRLGGVVSVGFKDGVSLTLNLTRASMTFTTRILVSRFASLASVFYATAVPLLFYGGFKVLAVAPLLRRQRQKEIEEKRAEKAREMLEKKREAEAAIELMRETVERVLSSERARQGLIIVEACYGKLFDMEPSEGLGLPKVIDVHVPLQCLVVDSKLILREDNKANIPGFYDPCVGETKYLRVHYEFRGTPHEVTVEDSEPLVIPRRSHRIVHFVD